MNKINVLETMGKRLRLMRTERGLSGREFAQRVGASNSLISKIENNVAEPSVTVLRAMCLELNISANYLLLLDDEPRSLAESAEREPVYYSPEADEVARMVDAMPPRERERTVAVVTALAEFVLDGDDDSGVAGANLVLGGDAGNAIVSRLTSGAGVATETGVAKRRASVGDALRRQDAAV